LRPSNNSKPGKKGRQIERKIQKEAKFLLTNTIAGQPLIIVKMMEGEPKSLNRVLKYLTLGGGMCKGVVAGAGYVRLTVRFLAPDFIGGAAK